MKMNTKRIGAWCAAIGMAALLSGCSSASFAAKNGAVESSYAMAEPASAYYVSPTEEAYGGAYYEGDYDYAYEDGMVAYAKSEVSTEAAEPDNRAEEQDKIIYSGDANIETVEFDASVEKTYELITRFGGFIQNSYITGKDYYTQYYNYNSYRTASFTIRVPREAFSAFRGSLAELGSVTYSSVSAENVSTAYHDTESRLKSARTQESRLLELIDEAKSVDEMLSIESRLSEVRYQIESLTTRITNWDSKINYSTVTLTIREVSRLTEEKPVAPTFGEKLVSGLKDSLEWIGDAAESVAVFIVSALPLLVIPAAVVIVLIVIIRRKHNKKKKALPKETENDVKDDD